MQVALVLLVCIAVYWVGLGTRGFHSSEGHRVIPAWAMLDSGDFVVPRMFGQVYVRKPPGIFWAIAASSELLGRTEFGARAVSAAAMTLGSLLSLVFARRWFGGLDPMAGLVAGLGHALSPWFWQIGRVAEIESLHQLTVQAAVFLLIDLAVGERRGPRATAAMSAMAGLSTAAMVLVKGPAGIPCIVGALAAACIVGRSIRALTTPGVRGTVLVAAVAIVAMFSWQFSALADTPETAISQSVSEFMWNPKYLNEVALLLPTALGSALPVAFALAYPWGPSPTPDARANRIARALAWVCVIALGIYLACGVSNRRYTLPAFSFLAPLGAFAAARIAAGTMIGVPRSIARGLFLDRTWVWFIGLIIGAGVWLGTVEPRHAVRGGREAGRTIADALAGESTPGAELWADDLVEARPDVLGYAVRDLAMRGVALRVLWKPIAEAPDFPVPGNYLALRTDKDSDEQRTFVAAGLADRAELVCSGGVHDFSFNVYRVRPR